MGISAWKGVTVRLRHSLSDVWERGIHPSKLAFTPLRKIESASSERKIVLVCFDKNNLQRSSSEIGVGKIGSSDMLASRRGSCRRLYWRERGGDGVKGLNKMKRGKVYDKNKNKM
jgi:hypothetical protein